MESQKKKKIREEEEVEHTKVPLSAGFVSPAANSSAVGPATNFHCLEPEGFDLLSRALHHPFTTPDPEDMNDLASAPALAYDMVYNGVEIGGGSLKIYKRDIQQKVLEIVGISMEQGLGSVTVRAGTDPGQGFCNEGMGQGIGTFGKRKNKTHTLCVRCGRRSFHLQKSCCGACAYPASRIRKL
ncbi:hypothetical protein L6164_015880 [Bauhinia variegata]|uniref:Uncharacterized protein n=1 Tax=Bauhinia variegata TaxID=167791 RepID=A0ACB9NLY0_BAUVA|nr:hypothetical protein L6164_015880 [Bauhinia variegata]